MINKNFAPLDKNMVKSINIMLDICENEKKTRLNTAKHNKPIISTIIG